MDRIEGKESQLVGAGQLILVGREMNWGYIYICAFPIKCANPLDYILWPLTTKLVEAAVTLESKA